MPAARASTVASFGAGTRAIAPLMTAIFPFGLVYGVAVSQSVVPDWQGGLASSMIMAGAAQFALIDLIDDGAPWIVAVGTALIINLRFAMYSAALAPSFGAFPQRWRLLLPAFMTDQAAVTSLLEFDHNEDPTHRRWFYLGAAVPFVLVWVAGTWLGIAFGADIPDSWQLGLAVPLVFIALLVPAVNSRPALVAAMVGGAGCLLAAPLPHSLGVIVGALVGVAAGMAVPTAGETSP